MIHSIVPSEELFFEGWENSISPLQDVTIGGISMQVTQMADGRAQIVRLISANPHDYMNPSYMPGNTISFVPKFE